MVSAKEHWVVNSWNVERSYMQPSPFYPPLQWPSSLYAWKHLRTRFIYLQRDESGRKNISKVEFRCHPSGAPWYLITAQRLIALGKQCGTLFVDHLLLPSHEPTARPGLRWPSRNRDKWSHPGKSSSSFPQWEGRKRMTILQDHSPKEPLLSEPSHCLPSWNWGAPFLILQRLCRQGSILVAHPPCLQMLIFVPFFHPGLIQIVCVSSLRTINLPTGKIEGSEKVWHSC